MPRVVRGGTHNLPGRVGEKRQDSPPGTSGILRSVKQGAAGAMDAPFPPRRLWPRQRMGRRPAREARGTGRRFGLHRALRVVSRCAGRRACRLAQPGSRRPPSSTTARLDRAHVAPRRWAALSHRGEGYGSRPRRYGAPGALRDARLLAAADAGRHSRRADAPQAKLDGGAAPTPGHAQRRGSASPRDAAARREVMRRPEEGGAPISY